jgi:hypothetical protein
MGFTFTSIIILIILALTNAWILFRIRARIRSERPRFKGDFKILRKEYYGKTKPREGPFPPLPDPKDDLTFLAQKNITSAPKPLETEENKRTFVHYSENLRHKFNDTPEIFYLNAFCIGVLRRTPKQEPLRSLFLNIWSEQREFMIANLDSRWLLSSLITFETLGENEAQRTTASLSAVFFNMMRLYETERILSLQPADIPRYFWKKASFDPFFMEFTPVALRAGDSDRNILKVILRGAKNDPITGAMLDELLHRMNNDKRNIFHRIGVIQARSK